MHLLLSLPLLVGVCQPVGQIQNEVRVASASGDQKDFVAIVSLGKMSLVYILLCVYNQNVFKLVNYEIRIL